MSTVPPGASIGAPRPGIGSTELLIVPTVVTPPTSVSEAYGLQPGPAVAGDDNTSSGIFPGFASGSRYRQNVDGRSSDPTLVVEIQPPAPGQQGATFGLRVQYQPPIGGGPAVPYADSGLLSIVPTFERWPFADAEIQAVPVASDGSMPADTDWSIIGQPQLATLADGSILCAFIAQQLAAPHAIDIVCKRFNPATDFIWTDFCTLGQVVGSPYTFQSFQSISGDLDVTLTGISLVVVGAQVYVWLSGNRGNPETHGIYYQYRLLGQTFATTAIIRVELDTDHFADGISVMGGPTPDMLIIDERVLTTSGSPPVMNTQRGPLIGAKIADLAAVGQVTIASGTGSPLTSAIGLLLQTAAARAGITQRPNGQILGFQDFAGVAFPDTDDLSSGNQGFAVMVNGRRFVTSDSGQSWTEQMGFGNDLLFITGVACAMRGTGELLGCIVGTDGYISVTTDGGANWTPRPLAIGDTTDFASVVIHGGTQTDPTKVTTDIWVSAKGNRGLWYSSNGGIGWKQIASWAGGNTGYYDMVTDGVTVLAVGPVGVHLTTNDPMSRACLFTAATQPSTAGPNATTIFYCDGVPGDANALFAVAANRSLDAALLTTPMQWCYAVTRDGQLWRFTSLSATTAAGGFDSVMNMGAIGGSPLIMDIATSSIDDQVVVVGLVGLSFSYGQGTALLWESAPGASTVGTGLLSMAPERLPTLPVAVAHLATQNGRYAIAGSNSTMMNRSEIFSQHGRPFMFQCPAPDNGAVMAIANLTLNFTELYRAEPWGTNGQPNFSYIGQGPTFAGVGLDLTPVPRGTFAVSNLGELLVTVGESGLVSLDWGRSWLQPNDPSLTIPVGRMTRDGDAVYDPPHIIATRASIGLSDGRLMSVAVGKAHGANGDLTTLGTFMAREWARPDQLAGLTLPLTYAPLQYPNGGPVPWHLMDALQLVIPGSPEPGDIWTFAPSYTFPPSNLAAESPSEFYRGQDHDQAQLVPPALPELELIWDRLDPDVVAVLGPGRFWNVCAFSLIGINFAVVEFAISDPGDDSQWITKQVSAAVQTGFAAVISAGSQCVLRDPLLAAGGDATHRPMIPSQYAPGYRRFTLAVALPQGDEGGSVHVYDIVDNTESDFILATSDGAQIPPDAAAAYAVISDRVAWLGDAPDSVPAAAAGLAELNGTPWRFGRYVRVRIPSQPTADGYFRIGSQIMGTFYDGLQPYAPGPVWQPITNTREEMALTGNSAVEFFDQGQHWQISFTALTRDMATALFSMLTRDKRLRQALMWIRETADPTSGELLRFDDAPVLQGIAEAAGDYSTLTWAAKEVL